MIDSCDMGEVGMTSWYTAEPSPTRPPSTGTTPKETTESRFRSKPVVSKSRAANGTFRQPRRR